MNELCPDWKLNITPKKVYGKNNKPQYTLTKACEDFVILLRTKKPYSKEEILWYLRGIFDAEGSIVTNYTHKLKGKDKRYFTKQISLTQGNIKLLKKIKNYLSKFNIESKLHFALKKRSCLVIKKNISIKHFNELIGFRIKRKEQRLKFAISKMNHSKMIDREIEKIRRLYLETPLGVHRIAKLMRRDKSAILYHLKDVHKAGKKGNHKLSIEEIQKITTLLGG